MIRPVRLLVWIHNDVDGGFDVSLNQSFRALCDCWRKGYWPVVIQTFYCRALGDRDDGGRLLASGDSGLDEVDVEDVRQNVGQLIGTIL